VTLAPLHQRLAASWQIDADADAKVDATNVLRSALVLCADHELNASSFAARVVASTGASLHASVGQGWPGRIVRPTAWRHDPAHQCSLG
jgi:citrate synthase